MGTGIHVVLGKIKRNPQEPITGTSLDIQDKQPEDFSLMNCPDEIEPNGGYDLFSWLAGIRGKVKPFGDIPVLRDKTREFLIWLENDINKDKHPWDSWRTIEYEYMMGDHSRVFYTVEELVNFNYDQIAWIEDSRSPSPGAYYQPIDGETYRDLFPGDYFCLLHYCQDEKWDFIIFGFDS